MDLFTFGFFRDAFLAGTLIAITAPIIGIFIVVKRYAPLADTLAHVSLVGVLISLLAGIPPLVGALISALLASFGVEKLKSSRQLFGESVLVVFLSGSLGLAAILLSLGNFKTSLNSFLFGSLTTVSITDVWQIGVVSCLVIITIIWFYRNLFLVSLDEDLAYTSGVAVKRMNYVIISLASLVISVSISSVGALLISSLLIIPVVTAIQFGKGFQWTLLIGIFLSVASVWGGIITSYYLDISTSGAIVCLNLAFFSISLIWGRNT